MGDGGHTYCKMMEDRDQLLLILTRIIGLARVIVAQRVKVDGLMLHSGTKSYVSATELDEILCAIDFDLPKKTD